MSHEEAGFIFKEYITPELVYDTFCVMLLKTARNSLFNQGNNKFNSVNMSVLNHQVIYKIYRHMAIISISHGLTYKITSRKLLLPINSLTRSVRNFMLHEQSEISTYTEYKLFIDGIQSLFNCFVESGLFVNITNEFKNGKQQKRFHFPTELSANLGRYTTPPRVTSPKIITRNNIMDSIIPTSFGKMTVTPSEEMLKSLNTSNKKKFSINKNFLYVLTELEEHKRFVY
jgi:hypothetical protein